MSRRCVVYCDVQYLVPTSSWQIRDRVAWKEIGRGVRTGESFAIVEEYSTEQAQYPIGVEFNGGGSMLWRHNVITEQALRGALLLGLAKFDEVFTHGQARVSALQSLTGSLVLNLEAYDSPPFRTRALHFYTEDTFATYAVRKMAHWCRLNLNP
jgi:hypothetical protein